MYVGGSFFTKEIDTNLEQNYSKGLHILATVSTDRHELLCSSDAFIAYVVKVFTQHGVESVGHTSHTFENNSFTASIILKESHLCIHTWPEFSNLQFDLYLCNYLQDNSEKVEKIANEIRAYFQGEMVQLDKVRR